ncbi:MAG: hypothetical protein Kapaf2KO_18770 [Candidatus Kapaibacteriales bacterium]
MRKILILAILAGLSLSAFAGQGKILSTKGNVEIEKDGTWSKLTKGYTLKKSDKVKISTGGYFALEGASGQPVEFSEAGTYSGAKLFAKSGKSGNASKKFGKFLVNELSQTDDLLSKGDYKKQMSTLGAVERALPVSSENDFDVVFPRNSFLYNSNIELVWDIDSDSESYTVYFKDSDGDIVKEAVSKENKMPLDVSGLSVDNGECYYWSVKSSSGKETGDYCLIFMDDNSYQSVKEDISMIEQEYGNDSPVGAYIKAKVYEENNMLVDADENYRISVELSGNDERFQLIYGNYLDRVTE